MCTPLSTDVPVLLLNQPILSRLDGVDPAGRAKMFIWRKVGSARRVTLPSKKGGPARRVTLPAEPTFCFSCKQFAKFCKEIWEKLARPG